MKDTSEVSIKGNDVVDSDPMSHYSLEEGQPVIDEFGLTRGLSRRHINMIAIAGMIVSLAQPSLHGITINKILGHRSFPRLRTSPSSSWTSWRSLRFLGDGIRNRRSVMEYC
jgi:hypothetical protein